MQGDLNTLISKYISGTLTRKAVTGGSLKTGDQEANDGIFVGRLQDFLRLNKNLIVTVYVIIIAVVIFLGVLIWLQRSNLPFVLGLLGGQGAGIFFGINKMQSIYKQNFVTRVILTLLNQPLTQMDKEKLLEMLKDFSN